MVNKRIGVSVGLVMVILGIAAYGVLRSRPEPGTAPVETAEKAGPSAGVNTEVYLYFAARDCASLSAERRVVALAADPVQSARAIIHALARGPRQADLVATVPAETACRALYVTADGTAYVDFSSAIREYQPGGSQAELLTVYAIVNSLAVNVDGIDRVKFLIEGREADTLAGHVDLRFAFAPDMRMVR